MNNRAQNVKHTLQVRFSNPGLKRTTCQAERVNPDTHILKQPHDKSNEGNCMCRKQTWHYIYSSVRKISAVNLIVLFLWPLKESHLPYANSVLGQGIYYNTICFVTVQYRM